MIISHANNLPITTKLVNTVPLETLAMLACLVHAISAIATIPLVMLAATLANMERSFGLCLLAKLNDFQDLL
jgi:hypothetical protein